MPDIAMCQNIKCPSRKQCFRFMAEPSDHGQCYADFIPDKCGYCDWFWDISLMITPTKQGE